MAPSKGPELSCIEAERWSFAFPLGPTPVSYGMQAVPGERYRHGQGSFPLAEDNAQRRREFLERKPTLSQQPTLPAVDRQNEPIKVGQVGEASGQCATVTKVLSLSLPQASDPEPSIQLS